MDALAHVVLGLHLVAGYSAQMVGPGAMLTQKRGLWQRRWGKTSIGRR